MSAPKEASKDPSPEALAFAENWAINGSLYFGPSGAIAMAQTKADLALLFDEATAALRERAEKAEKNLLDAAGTIDRQAHEVEDLGLHIAKADDLAEAVEMYGRAPALLAALAAYREGK